MSAVYGWDGAAGSGPACGSACPVPTRHPWGGGSAGGTGRAAGDCVLGLFAWTAKQGSFVIVPLA